MNLRLLLRSNAVIGGVLLLVVIAWITGSALAEFEVSLRRNTEFAPNFTEAAFQTIKKGDSAESVLKKLGQPAGIMFYDDNTVYRIQADRTLEWINSDALLSYSRSYDGSERLLMRFISVRKGQVQFAEAKWGVLPGGID